MDKLITTLQPELKYMDFRGSSVVDEANQMINTRRQEFEKSYIEQRKLKSAQKQVHTFSSGN